MCYVLRKEDIKEILKDASEKTPYKFALYDINYDYDTIVLNVNEKGSSNRYKMYVPFVDSKAILCANLADKFNCGTYFDEEEAITRKYFLNKQREYFNKAKKERDVEREM